MDGRIEEMRREELVGEEAEGNPGVGQTGGNQDAKATSGNPDVGQTEGNQEAGVDKGDQEAGEELAGERAIFIIGKSVRFAPDLPTANGGRG